MPHNPLHNILQKSEYASRKKILSGELSAHAMKIRTHIKKILKDTNGVYKVNGKTNFVLFFTDLRAALGLPKYVPLRDFLTYVEYSMVGQTGAKYDAILKRLTRKGLTPNRANYHAKDPTKLITHQGEYIKQGLNEIIANAIDATVPDGAIGRFGEGFYQSLKFLTSPSNTLIVSSKTAEEEGFSVHFRNISQTSSPDIEIGTFANTRTNSGTTVQLQRSLSQAEQEEFITWVTTYTKTNHRVPIFVNNTQVNTLSNSTNSYGENTSVGIQGRVDIEIDETGFRVIDGGIGMSPDTLATKLIAPHASGKTRFNPDSLKYNDLRDVVNSQADFVFVRYPKGETSEHKNGEYIKKSTTIRLEVGGFLIEQFSCVTGGDIESCTLKFPSFTWLPESRNQIDLTRTVIVSLGIMFERLENFVNTSDQLHILDILAHTIYFLEEHSSNTDTSSEKHYDIIHIARSNFRKIYTKLKAEGKTVLPYMSSLHEALEGIETPPPERNSDSLVWVDPIFLEFDILSLPQVQSLEGVSGHRVPFFSCPFHPRSPSNVVVFPDAILINSHCIGHGNSAIDLLNTELNLSTGYEKGEDKIFRGTIGYDARLKPQVSGHSSGTIQRSSHETHQQSDAPISRLRPLETHENTLVESTWERFSGVLKVGKYSTKQLLEETVRKLPHSLPPSVTPAEYLLALITEKDISQFPHSPEFVAKFTYFSERSKDILVLRWCTTLALFRAVPNYEKYLSLCIDILQDSHTSEYGMRYLEEFANHGDIPRLLSRFPDSGIDFTSLTHISRGNEWLHAFKIGGPEWYRAKFIAAYPDVSFTSAAINYIFTETDLYHTCNERKSIVRNGEISSVSSYFGLPSGARINGPIIVLLGGAFVEIHIPDSSGTLTNLFFNIGTKQTISHYEYRGLVIQAQNRFSQGKSRPTLRNLRHTSFFSGGNFYEYSEYKIWKNTEGDPMYFGKNKGMIVHAQDLEGKLIVIRSNSTMLLITYGAQPEIIIPIADIGCNQLLGHSITQVENTIFIVTQFSGGQNVTTKLVLINGVLEEESPVVYLFMTQGVGAYKEYIQKRIVEIYLQDGSQDTITNIQVSHGNIYSLSRDPASRIAKLWMNDIIIHASEGMQTFGIHPETGTIIIVEQREESGVCICIDPQTIKHTEIPLQGEHWKILSPFPRIAFVSNLVYIMNGTEVKSIDLSIYTIAGSSNFDQYKKNPSIRFASPLQSIALGGDRGLQKYIQDNTYKFQGASTVNNYIICSHGVVVIDLTTPDEASFFYDDTTRLFPEYPKGFTRNDSGIVGMYANAPIYLLTPIDGSTSFLSWKGAKIYESSGQVVGYQMDERYMTFVDRATSFTVILDLSCLATSTQEPAISPESLLFAELLVRGGHLLVPSTVPTIEAPDGGSLTLSELMGISRMDAGFLRGISGGFPQILGENTSPKEAGDREMPSLHKFLTTVVSRIHQRVQDIFKIPSKNLSHTPQKIPEFTTTPLALSALDGTLIQHKNALLSELQSLEIYQREILGTIDGQDQSGMIWIRESIQNARDALRHLRRLANMSPDSMIDEISIDFFQENGHFGARISDPVGMSLYTVWNHLLTPGISSKTTEDGSSGMFGQGFWSLAIGAQVVRLKTGDGTTMTILKLTPIHNSAGNLHDIQIHFQTKSSGYKGTTIERIDATSGLRGNMSALIGTEQTRKYVGGVSDMRITLNGTLINPPESHRMVATIPTQYGDIFLVHQLGATTGHIKSDGLYMNRIDPSFIEILPGWVQTWLKDRAYHIDFARGYSPNKTRNAFTSKEQFLPHIRSALFRLVSSEIVREYIDAKVTIPLLPHDYFALDSYEKELDSRIQNIAHRINSDAKTLLTLDEMQFLQDSSRYAQFLIHLEVLRNDALTSLANIKHHRQADIRSQNPYIQGRGHDGIIFNRSMESADRPIDTEEVEKEEEFLKTVTARYTPMVQALFGMPIRFSIYTREGGESRAMDYGFNKGSVYFHFNGEAISEFKKQSLPKQISLITHELTHLIEYTDPKILRNFFSYDTLKKSTPLSTRDIRTAGKDRKFGSHTDDLKHESSFLAIQLAMIVWIGKKGLLR